MTERIKTAEKEKAILIGIKLKAVIRNSALQSLEELKVLVLAAGAEVIEKILCEVDFIRSSTFIGKGKVLEIQESCRRENLNLIVFNEDLSPAQQRNLERETGIRVIDRTGIILDIFARRAATREGKLQVELAQLNYLLPRLTRMWEHLSRLGAGIGTRGPGETQLELDRRRIRQRINKLKDEIEKVKKTRRLHRSGRHRQGILTSALVGYTNAGKSSLINQLTGSSVLVMDQVFATLDPTLRMLNLPNNLKVIVSDTVGFISKLPHQLVAAFRATLEEVVEADILIQVVDASSDQKEFHIFEVNAVLEELGVANKPMIMLYNKIDLVPGISPGKMNCNEGPESFAVSAVTGSGIQEFIECICSLASKEMRYGQFRIPFNQHDLVALIRREGDVLKIDYSETGTLITARLKPALYNKMESFIVST